MVEPNGAQMTFKDIADDAVLVEDDARITLSGGTAVGWLNGGGNTGAGIRVVGDNVNIKLDSGTTVTGTDGDVKVDGAVGGDGPTLEAFTYSQLTTEGPLTLEATFTKVERE